MAAFQGKPKWELTRELGGFANMEPMFQLLSLASRAKQAKRMVLKKTNQSGQFFEIMPLASHTWLAKRDRRYCSYRSYRRYRRYRSYRSYLFFCFFKNYLRGFLALRHPLYAIDKLSPTLNICILDLQIRRMAFRFPPPSPFIFILAKVYPSAMLRRAN